MKKRTIILLTIIALIFTFVVAEMFSVYHFGSVPTTLTFLYLIFIFVLFEYSLMSIVYIIGKLIKKERIKIKTIIGFFLLFVAILLLLLLLIVLNIDYLHWYMYSSPFYFNVIVRCVEFLFPSVILMIISILLIRNKK